MIMQKRVVLALSISIILILSISLVSAFSLPDFFKNLFGKNVQLAPYSDGTSFVSGRSCNDTDGGIFSEKAGQIYKVESRPTLLNSDRCVNSTSIREYFCSNTYSVNDIVLSCKPGFLCKSNSNGVGYCEKVPVVVNNTCTDSDGGIDYYIRGYVEVKDSKGVIIASDWDDCDEEFYCKADGTAGIIAPACPNGCSNGACISNNQTTNQNVFGWTNFTSGSFALKHQDSCSLVLQYDSNGIPAGWQSADNCSGNDCFVQEAFCRTDDQGNFIDADADKLISCPNGCSNGACIQSNQTATCTDSDGGPNLYIKGITKGLRAESGQYEENEDACGNGNNYPQDFILEWYCNNNRASIFQVPTKCPNGCSNGACISNNQTTNITCTDSDGNSNSDYLIKGNIVGVNQQGYAYNLKDYCYSGPEFSNLQEYFCQSNGVDNVKGIDCSVYGMVCSDGACLPSNNETTNITCTDSDGGLNQNIFGWTNFTSGSFALKHQDSCSLVLQYDSNGVPAGWQSADNCSGNDCFVQEAFCRTDDQGNFIDADADKLISCPNGCSNGACRITETFGFPETIGEFSLKSVNPDRTGSCVNISDKNVCFSQARLEYQNGNRAVHLILTKIFSEKEAYIDYVLSNGFSEENFKGIPGVYLGKEHWELFWFTDKDYDFIGTQDYIYNYRDDGSMSTTILNATITSVTNWALDNYPQKILSSSQCTDTDGGLSYFTAGKVTNKDLITDADVCLPLEFPAGKQSAVREFFCNSDGTTGSVEKECLNGCLNSACITNTTSTKDCFGGCIIKDKCVDVGFRNSGKYCTLSGNFTKQKSTNAKCDNHFECSSYVCVSGKCVSQGMIEKFLSWLRKVFR